MQFAKHIHVLHLLSTVPSATLEYRSRERYPYESGCGPFVMQHYRQIMTVQEANDAWDHIFTYIFAHWGEPQTAMGQDMNWNYVTAAGRVEVFNCQAMLRMKSEELIAKLESLPPYFTESVFPVAVARYLLRDIRIPMNYRDTTTFKDFHRRYGIMILGD